MSTREILYNFEENLKHLSSINLINFKKMPKLMIENEFKSFVKHYLNSIISSGRSEQDINKILENKITNKLENLLKSIIEYKELFGNNIENDEYSKQFNDIKKTADQKLQFKKMQELLASILNNENLRKKIENGLWEEYFEIQKICDSLPSKGIQESMTNYLYQVQADPLKRAFYIMFTAFFEIYAREKYIESKGNVNLDNSLDNTDEQNDKPSNGLAEHFRHLRGVPFPAP